MPGDDILVEVFDGVAPAGGWSCSSGCDPENGCGAVVEEQALQLEQKLKEKYGKYISVKYIDTEKTGVKKYFTIARVVQMGYSFPIVAVNGKPRLAGGIDFEVIQNLIGEIIGEK